MLVHVDIRWLLERQSEIMPSTPEISDYSALVAAVARHRVNTPRLGIDPDPAWCAAALLHTVLRLEPLPARNSFFACALVPAYMHMCAETIDAGPKELIELAQRVRAGEVDVFDVARRIRDWRV
ncbi:toxin Doc [Mangrovactinospora gilvigrisea]|uniref:Toxin Doc n=1 Tax=Mangrovactinospora gilvigrisea TaxID=1428644 RepID=A0A1J7BEP2_9ACTN|nr:toxin Doc [Mangrovactinospora gilvigrisea]OIV37110.1 toxin Doc [Mangrovactinospora gilvigrisea]